MPPLNTFMYPYNEYSEIHVMEKIFKDLIRRHKKDRPCNSRKKRNIKANNFDNTPHRKKNRLSNTNQTKTKSSASNVVVIHIKNAPL